MTKPSHEFYQEFIQSCKDAFIGRDLEFECLATALISGMPLCLVGAPGTGKSRAVTEFSKAINKGFFVYLITRYTTPDELFGHFSLKALKERDSYERQMKGKLPEAEVVFLDEVFKASSALLNSLLTVMNEGEVDVGNGQRKKTDIQLFVGASNEYPFDDESLGALWDRWVFRCNVADIPLMKKDKSGKTNFDRLINDQSLGTVNYKLDFDHVVKIKDNAEKVDVSPVMQDIEKIMAFLMSKKIHVSSRRWRKVVQVIKARAAMDGRTEAKPIDLLILSEVLWNRPEQRPAIARFIRETCAGMLNDAMKYLDAAKQIAQSLNHGSSIAQFSVAKGQILELMRGQGRDLKDSDDPQIASIYSEVKDIYREIRDKITEINAQDMIDDMVI